MVHAKEPEIQMSVFALAVVLLHTVCMCLLMVCLFVSLCASSSRCQHSSWLSSSSSCRSSRSSSSTCSTFRGKDCSASSLDRLACHCTPSLRVSTSYVTAAQQSSCPPALTFYPQWSSDDDLSCGCVWSTATEEDLNHYKNTYFKAFNLGARFRWNKM